VKTLLDCTAMILVIDNYDSFIYNLVQYLGELGAAVEVFRNDAIDVAGIERRAPEGILISPGPGTPDDAGVTLDVIRRLGGTIPLLGVCLGHQAIAQAFGGKVVRASRLMHGRTSAIEHDGRGVFAGLPSPFRATRYHSLIVEPSTLPAALQVTAWTAEGELMALRHERFAIEGVQFHPESFLTEHGHAMLRNFLNQLPDRGARRAEAA
jgi:anthranilate synthase/aminodeoxychorismate synthase-like glutamine amidotransferase